MGKNLFNSIKLTKPKKSHFDLSHDVKMSLDMGDLAPVLCMECVPGDKFNISAEALVRFAPLIAPVMHRIDVYIHYFFVPNRILWSNWEKFIVSTDGSIVAPYIQMNPGAWGLPQYLGLPYATVNTYNANALPFAAYQRIYNEYYRDQNLVSEVYSHLIDGNNGSDAPALQQLRVRAWEHDYFTSALPFAQKGAAVEIPLGSIDHNVPVFGNTTAGSTTLSGSPFSPTIGTDPDGSIASDLYAQTQGLASGSAQINDLRRAFRLQEWLEKNARAGTRYVENILAHFGVKSSDARLQRPEYITGVKSPVVISEVLNTTGATDGLPQGNMAGHGVGVTTGQYGSYFCEEHGYLMGIMSIMPKTCYQQGIPKHFLKTDPLDYYWPAFAHLGEQEVLNQELYADHTSPGSTFGYVPRYAEYKFMPNRVAGDFINSLNYWHMGRIFSSDPSLNEDFVDCDATKRIFAVTDPSVNSVYCHVLNKISAVRPMPKFGTPMI